MGKVRLNTKAFQFDCKAIPGKAKKLILLTKVAKIDMDITHLGIALLPSVNAEVFLFFRKNEAPKKVMPSIYARNITRSIIFMHENDNYSCSSFATEYLQIYRKKFNIAI